MRGLLDTASETQPEHRSNGGGGGGGNDNFDTNMVVVLAVLLCVLICALGLNSIVRCVLRCGGRRTVSAAAAYETAEEAAARHAVTGLKKKALRQIPVAVFGTEGAVSVVGAATECPICLGEYADGERVRVLPKCNHGFHVECIDRWLASHSLCPMCRGSVVEKAAAEPESPVVVVVDQVS